jgi:hypothetical protein
MITLPFEIELMSDGEPGTGLGIETTDQLLPRSAGGRPIIPASHLKGLVREQLMELGQDLGWPMATITSEKPGESATDAQQVPTLVKVLLGAGGKTEADGGVVYFSDAEAERDAPKLLIHRSGSAAHSLRITEALPTGMKLGGRLVIDCDLSGAAAAMQLALHSITSIGSNRNRGSGACVIRWNKETNPNLAVLLAQVDELARKPEAELLKAMEDSGVESVDPVLEIAGETAWYRLTFRAEQPVCCPERPVRTNVIRSGIAIPASAVQGVILTILAKKGMADACYGHVGTRFWPLQPTGPYTEIEGIPVRTSLTHRQTKANRDEPTHFGDATLGQARDEARAWKDGVLVPLEKDFVRFLPASHFPRSLAAHVALGTGSDQQLYSVESMAPQTWTGLVALPVEAGEALEAEIGSSRFVAFGKRRTVQGQGTLRITRLDDDHAIFAPARTFIVQEAGWIPDDWEIGNVHEVFKKLLPAVPAPDEAHAEAACRFGFNRRDTARTKGKGLIRARNVISAGSVFSLEHEVPAEQLKDYLLRGFGANCESEAGRLDGLGAILPHPGVAQATESDDDQSNIDSYPKSESGPGVTEGLAIFRSSRNHPSPSQISSLCQKADREGRDAVLAYLQHQKEDRGRFWFSWQPFHEFITKVEDPEKLRGALHLWRNLVTADRREEAR